MKIHLGKRYYLISGSMGNYGEPLSNPNHRYQVVSGIDRGNGYQGYMACTYAISKEGGGLPDDVRAALRKALQSLGEALPA